MSLGSKLEEIMNERGYTQTSLSKAANIPRSTIQGMIERDASKVDIKILLKLCKILHVSPEIFYAEYYTENPENFPSEWGAIRAFLNNLSNEELQEVKLFLEFLKFKREQKNKAED